MRATRSPQRRDKRGDYDDWGHTAWVEPGRERVGRPSTPIAGIEARHLTAGEARRQAGAGARRRRPTSPRHQRPGFKPDRVAMWAVVLGVLLVLVAATSSHAAISTPVPRTAAASHAPALAAGATAAAAVRTDR
ncbi:MAG: hypothetical protein ABSG43_08845 [Solirubrobacteraceae bacterium]